MPGNTTQERFKRGAADAGDFFRYIAAFVGFTDEHAAAIRETRFVIEKHIPDIVSGFYVQLLRFPATRRLFQRDDGSIDRDYLELRMQHQANFWRRAASGEYDADFARYVDYVGRSHTSSGADPSIYIPERYVIGMVGFVQQRISSALEADLGELDPDLQRRATRAWNAFLMVILEMLARGYSRETEKSDLSAVGEIDDEAVRWLAVETYERALGMARTVEYEDVFVARAADIPEGKRKIIEAGGQSIGVFHHKGDWYALSNSCLHRGGPVCTGDLTGDILTCPWHGYQYDVTNGKLTFDPSAQLLHYPVTLQEGNVYVRVRTLVRDEAPPGLEEMLGAAVAPPQEQPLAENEFRLADLSEDRPLRVEFEGVGAAVVLVDGAIYAVQERCSHAGGPLSQGRLDGFDLICPWHDSCFDVRSGEPTCGPARKPLQVFAVELDGNVGRVWVDRVEGSGTEKA